MLLLRKITNSIMKKVYIGLTILGLCGISILFYYNIGIPCIFYKITGLYCPGCGITRAVKSFMKLDFYQAFRYNPVVPIVLLILGIDKVYRTVRKKERTFSNLFWIFLLIIVIIFGVLRNLPMFRYLAPTQIY